LQENGVQTAIQAIYRDLDYAKSLVKMRAASENTLDAPLGDDEESWTFIGDESDPELRKLIQGWDQGNVGRPPRVSLDRTSLDLSGRRASRAAEAVVRRGSPRR
jgi:hypothetical protein